MRGRSERVLDEVLSTYLLHLLWLFGVRLSPSLPPSFHLSDRQLLADSIQRDSAPVLRSSISLQICFYIFHFPPLSPNRVIGLEELAVLCNFLWRSES